MSGISLFAQDLKSDIEKQFRIYNNLIIEKKYEKAIDLYANEEFLKIIPKKTLVEMIDQVFNSPEVQFRVELPKNIQVDSKIIEEKGNKFVKLEYDQKLEMKTDDAESNKENILVALQSTFGQEHVRFDEKSGFFIINTTKVAVANSSDNENWKFSVLERHLIPILKQFIPHEFLKDLK